MKSITLNLFTLVEGRSGLPNTFPTRLRTPNLEYLFSKWLFFFIYLHKWFSLISLKIKVATLHFSHFGEELRPGDRKIPCGNIHKIDNDECLTLRYGKIDYHNFLYIHIPLQFTKMIANYAYSTINFREISSVICVYWS